MKNFLSHFNEILANLLIIVVVISFFMWGLDTFGLISFGSIFAKYALASLALILPVNLIIGNIVDRLPDVKEEEPGAEPFEYNAGHVENTKEDVDMDKEIKEVIKATKPATVKQSKALIKKAKPSKKR